MFINTIFLAVPIFALLISKPVWCVSCTAGGNECAATEKCPTDTCTARVACEETTDCSNQGTCEDDYSCTCDAGYTGNDCSLECSPVCVKGNCKLEGTNPVCDCTDTGFEGDACNEVMCDSTKCTLPKVCVGPSGSETCVADPCKDTTCGEHGDCSYDKTEAAPSPVCTCKNGYGGTTCTNMPECQTSADCTDTDKPECKKEEGKQSVCAEKANNGNIVAAAPGIIVAVLLAAVYL